MIKLLFIKDIKTVEATYELVRRMRASFWFWGLCYAVRPSARDCRAAVLLALRSDLHLKLQGFGAQSTLEHGYVDASRGGSLRRPCCVGFSECWGHRELVNGSGPVKGESAASVAREPEIIHLTTLKSVEAQIQGIGTGILRIEGVDTLNGSEAVPADRIETGTFIAAACDWIAIQLNHVLPDELDAVLDRFEATGAV